MTTQANEVTILLVEDDDVDVLSIERAFKKNRIANPIVRARNGKEALDFLAESKVVKPYIILLDLNMPVMGGLEFLRHIRSDDKLAQSVIFVLTTSSADEDITSAYKENIAGYFLKNEASAGVNAIVDVLDGYWKIVHLPK